MVSLAAIVALVLGAPTTPVACGTTATVAWGEIDSGRVVMSAFSCNVWERYPWRGGYLAARGMVLLTAVHEAEHVRYDDVDEARTECRALRDLPAVLDALLPAGGDPLERWVRDRVGGQLEAAALALDAEAPPAYHGGSCEP